MTKTKPESSNSIQDQSSNLFSTYIIVGWLTLIIITIIISILYRSVAVRLLTDTVQNSNVTIAEEIKDSLGQNLEFYVNNSPRFIEDGDEHPRLDSVRQEIHLHMNDSSVVRVNIYTPERLTVFSTEVTEIGQYTDDTSGFRNASNRYRRSEVTSLIHYDSFNISGTPVEDRDIISSYVSIRQMDGYGTMAVIEIYEDVTPSIQKITRTQRNGIGGAVLTLTLLFGGALFMRRESKKE